MRRDPIKYWVEIEICGKKGELLQLKNLLVNKKIVDYTVEAIDGSLVITLFPEGTEPIKIKLTSEKTSNTVGVAEIRRKNGLHIFDSVYWYKTDEVVPLLDKTQVKRVFFWTDDRWYVVCFDRDPYWHPKRIVLAYDWVDYVNIAMKEV